MGKEDDALTRRLAEIRGGARKRSPNVRVLASFAGLSQCRLASLGFAARVDFDSMLRGTEYASQYGQSPFAFQRGNLFEGILRKDGYEAARRVLSELPGFDPTPSRVRNLRRPTYTTAVMSERARETRKELAAIVSGDSTAPSLVDGAVFETLVGGLAARFEADAVAARGKGQIHAGEVKSFPVVDGRGDPDKIGAALDQAAVYILLLRREVELLGADPALVSSEALLITPRNVGLQPMLSRKRVDRQISRISRLLASVPHSGDLISGLPYNVSFAAVADAKSEPEKRIDALREIAERTGTSYGPNCMASCGNARFCREEAFKAGDPAAIGPQAVRQLAGIDTLNRAAEITRGAPLQAPEEAAGQPLARASRLYDRLMKPTKRRRRSVA